MKKLFILFISIASALAMNSCSGSGSDNDNPEPGGTITFKSDGVLKTFHVVTVSENLYFENTPDEYSELFVFAQDDALPGETIHMTLYKEHMEDIVNYFYYVGETEYTRDWTDFAMHLTANNNGKLKGTFTGHLQPYNSSEEIMITDGVFDIRY